MASRSRGIQARQGRDTKQGLDEEAELRGSLAAGVEEAGALVERLDKITEDKKVAQAEISKYEEKSKNVPISAYDKLEAVMREESKYSEQLVALLKDPGQNLIEKASLLSALHPATEPQPRNAASAKARNPKRAIGETDSAVGSPAPLSDANVEKTKKSKTHMQRSTSVASQVPREVQATKPEEGVDGARGSAAEKAGTLKVGAAVMYRPNKASHNFDGEGIQCTIKSLLGDGAKKRITYQVQDDEANDQGKFDEYRAVAADLIPIPESGSNLPTFAVGRQVLARYPETTTFYKAEVMSSKKESYNLKFEGEEDDMERVVARRFVLDLGSR